MCITALVTGGVGLRSLGSDTFGGKKYVYLISAIAGYFALACQKIPKERAKFWILLFFLPGLTWVVGYLSSASGSLGFLQNLFPSDSIVDDGGDPTVFVDYIHRAGDMATAALALFCALMAYHGIKGILDLKKPWRLLLLGLTLAVSLFAGFRSMLVLLSLTFIVQFYFEGLFKTRYFLILLMGGILVCSVTLPVVHKLPLSVQRTLSFLPINVDPVARRDAESSTAWRVDMWKELMPLVPKYLIKGKGYGLNPDELFMAWESSSRGHVGSAEISLMAGDYHSGPLSLIIPFGIFGVIAFLWFLGASFMVLYRNYRHGDPVLRQINTFLLAYFTVRVFHFFFIFGSIHSDLFFFTGLIGLSVSLNQGAGQPIVELEATREVEI
ncbi:hypothetical protein Cflav_PD0403 [Pedosphaera parvula Ellin514]|uniref:O-antigen polymerase n=1 Tax=Pedosphaera parvula (strain Ellin514) TaxID=320771 RepID=B9XSB7_PEDPL|nr:hypothetical protein Cflav_PD0403 [Pedosphaera parvula Ellin514]